MKRTILWNVALGLSLALSGCGGKGDADANAPTAPNAPAATEESASDPAATEENATSQAEETLNFDDAESPESVVDAFFQTFFKGDDDGAFALLTSKARQATAENFSAQASDTIKWTVTRKTAEENGRVFVYVDVEDYTDAGEIQTEELTFALTDADSAWRVAGFSVGGVAINFEDRQINAVAQENPAPKAAETSVKVGQNAETVVR